MNLEKLRVDTINQYGNGQHFIHSYQLAHFVSKEADHRVGREELRPKALVR